MFSLKLNRANILYLILFTGVFSDLIRVHGSSITLYRLLMFLGLAIAVSIRYKKVLYSFVILIALLLFNIIQGVLFTSIFDIVKLDFRHMIKYEYFYVCIIITVLMVVSLRIYQGAAFKELCKRFIYIFSFFNVIIFTILAIKGVYWEGRSIISNVNDYGAELTAFFPILCVDAIEERKKSKYLACIYILVLEYINDCKLCFLGILVEMFILLLLYGKTKYGKKIIIKVCSYIAVICMAIFVIFFVFLDGAFFGVSIGALIMEPIRHLLQLDLYTVTDGSAAFRVNVFIMGIIWMFRSCFMGMGAGSTMILAKEFLTMNTYYTSPYYGVSPHNAWLEILLDFGFLALIAYIYILKYGIYSLVGKTRKKTYIPSVICALSIWLWVLAPSGIYTNYGLIIILMYYFIMAKDYKKELPIDDFVYHG